MFTSIFLCILVRNCKYNAFYLCLLVYPSLSTLRRLFHIDKRRRVVSINKRAQTPFEHVKVWAIGSLLSILIIYIAHKTHEHNLYDSVANKLIFSANHHRIEIRKRRMTSRNDEIKKWRVHITSTTDIDNSFRTYSL